MAEPTAPSADIRTLPSSRCLTSFQPARMMLAFFWMTLDRERRAIALCDHVERRCQCSKSPRICARVAALKVASRNHRTQNRFKVASHDCCVSVRARGLRLDDGYAHNLGLPPDLAGEGPQRGDLDRSSRTEDYSCAFDELEQTVRMSGFGNGGDDEEWHWGTPWARGAAPGRGSLAVVSLQEPVFEGQPTLFSRVTRVPWPEERERYSEMGAVTAGGTRDSEARAHSTTQSPRRSARDSRRGVGVGRYAWCEAITKGKPTVWAVGEEGLRVPVRLQTRTALLEEQVNADQPQIERERDEERQHRRCA